ncbi:MAG: SDR family NAD(P)-dependent oxidoreductase [Gallionella sp.]|nr:SDR family NAD(P)-dependent oxidoreductase [Gallionella sp.]
MKSTFENKSILVTGACGTVGSELIRQLLSLPEYAPAEVIGIDNNESQLFFLDQQYLKNTRANFFVADIRDRDELTRKMAGVDIVFHCAALKHVILCERSPEQAVQTNIQGVQNVIAAAQANGVGKVIFTSSDKAVNPTNVMGTSKLMGERLMTAANSNKRGQGPIFASTRFGNVLGSNGSVIPIFHNQIAKGGPITLTHRDMTRFVMSIEESVKLVIDSAMLAKGGEVFITKMPVVRIEDLAKAMVEELASLYGFATKDIQITEIGTKPGEKLYEELMSPEETRRALELKKYFSVLPAFRGIYRDIQYDYPDFVTETVTNPYVSAEEQPITVEQIRQLLKDYKLLGTPDESTQARYWPGDKEDKK